jgi:hypothetical protein
VPWTLYYRTESEEDRRALLLESHQLRDSQDVAYVDESEIQGSVSHVRLLIAFEDELYRTSDPVLLEIHERRRTLEPEAPVDATNASLIALYLASAEGRASLARTMAEPIRRRMDYQALGRQLFAVEPMPQGALPIYEPADLPGDVTLTPDPDDPTMIHASAVVNLPPMNYIALQVTLSPDPERISGWDRVLKGNLFEDD